MENASKALIIAGAILLAILIIGLGIFIYRQAANTVSDTGMDSIAIQQFNGQFENYIKDNVSGATVRALKTIIDTNNSVECNNDKDHPKYIDKVIPEGISTVGKYDITAEYENGLISKITVTEHTTQTNSPTPTPGE